MYRKRIQLLLGSIVNVPILTWVLLGFSISYLLFFVRPIFFSAQYMQFTKYVPAMDPIGVDLKNMLGFCESWFIAGQTPYIGSNLYPPLASVLFTPLLIFGYSLAYKIVSLVTLLCYVLITLVFPLRTGEQRQISPLLMLVLITGLFSYGFQFELERGQFNVIAISLCFLGIWIYHCRSKYRYFAYFLFIISVQLKVFPFIFIVMLIHDWRDWKNNIKKFFLLGGVNFVLFFVLGFNVFNDFIIAIKDQIDNPFSWVGNHSIRSFVTFISNIASGHGWTWVKPNTVLVEVALLAIIISCIFIIIQQAYRQKQTGINSHLFLACTIGALLIPSVSHDYKLSILAAPVAILFANERFSFSEKPIRLRLQIIFIVLVFITSAAYSSTLFSFTQKPNILGNNFPALITMLLAITFLSLMPKPNHDLILQNTVRDQEKQNGKRDKPKH